jgi:hypothetical protein
VIHPGRPPTTVGLSSTAKIFGASWTAGGRHSGKASLKWRPWPIDEFLLSSLHIDQCLPCWPFADLSVDVAKREDVTAEVVSVDCPADRRTVSLSTSIRWRLPGELIPLTTVCRCRPVPRLMSPTSVWRGRRWSAGRDDAPADRTALHTSPVQVSRSTVALLTSGRVRRTRPVRVTGAGAMRTRSAVSCNSVSLVLALAATTALRTTVGNVARCTHGLDTTAWYGPAKATWSVCSTLTSPRPLARDEDRRRGPNGTGKVHRAPPPASRRATSSRRDTRPAGPHRLRGDVKD